MGGRQIVLVGKDPFDDTEVTRQALDFAGHSTAPDSQFGTGGYAFFDFDLPPSTADEPVAIALMSGRPVVGGWPRPRGSCATATSSG